MTDQEIEQKRERLVEIKKIKDSGEKNIAIIELIREVGAAGCAAMPETFRERDALNIASIHQALQTATMVNMCKSAAKGYEVAVNASESAKKSGKAMAVIAIIALILALISALAAWAAVIVGIITN